MHPWQIMLCKTTELSTQDSVGQRPLHAAAKHGHADAAYRLLEGRAVSRLISVLQCTAWWFDITCIKNQPIAGMIIFNWHKTTMQNSISIIVDLRMWIPCPMKNWRPCMLLRNLGMRRPSTAFDAQTGPFSPVVKGHDAWYEPLVFETGIGTTSVLRVRQVLRHLIDAAANVNIAGTCFVYSEIINK